MATKIGVFAYSYLDFRFTADVEIIAEESEALFPFYTMCWLVPASKVATYLVGDYENYKFYKISEANYATKCLDQLLAGATRFYAQQHSEAEMGIIVFEDSFSLDPDNPTTKTEYVDAPQATRLATMNKALNALGRTAIGVGIAETDKTAYNMYMDDFRQVDTYLNYFKVKIKDTLADTEAQTTEIINDYQSFGGTIMAINNFTNETVSTSYDFKNRLDFVIGGLLLNPYKPVGSDVTFEVGMGLDGRIAVIANADVVKNNVRDAMDKLTRNYITYLQVRADDPDEYVVSGGGVYYQGFSIPINIFLFAKYAQYRLKINLFDFQTKYNKAGTANVTIYNQAIQATMTELEPYTSILLASVSSKSYTQNEINDSISDKTIKLSGCITATTLPTPLFTTASITTYIQL